jgi:transcriptional regulator with XRE-family HTH domain
MSTTKPQTDSLRKTVGKNIAHYRRREGLSQQSLADALGHHQVTIAKWESGKYMPRPDTLQKIAECLDCQVSSLATSVNR